MNRVEDKRISTLLSHVNRARGRTNLTIRPNCLADRLIIDGARVSGVLLTDGAVEQAETVVLCAGSIGSPAILLRSGVGPARDLVDKV